MIYVSTGGMSSQQGLHTALELFENGINGVELSGGLHSATVERDLLKVPKQLDLQIHNYFPPPLEPFVFNLASADELTFKRSFDHVCSCILLAHKLGLSTYSFHGGFRISPEVKQLGRSLGRHALSGKEEAYEIFEDALLELSKIASEKNIELLIENNVLTRDNFELYGESPLLFCEPLEISTFMKKMPSNVGLLFDFGHLKVSAKTLGFHLFKSHAELEPWIRAYHLSENDGNRDSNESISKNSWFWSVINPHLRYYSLEVYGVTSNDLFLQQEMAIQQLDKLKNKL